MGLAVFWPGPLEAVERFGWQLGLGCDAYFLSNAMCPLVLLRMGDLVWIMCITLPGFILSAASTDKGQIIQDVVGPCGFHAGPFENHGGPDLPRGFAKEFLCASDISRNRFYFQSICLIIELCLASDSFSNRCVW